MKLKGQWEEIMRKTVILETEIEELIKVATDDRPENCEGMLGYETNAPGDGIFGTYFDNEDFIGSGVKELDLNVEFEWNG